MSLEVSLATLAEGVTSDARGSLTLVAVNPYALIADQLPAQFGPVFVATIEDSDAEQPVIVPGINMSARVEATGPDDVVLFVTQMRQTVVPPPHPTMRPRVQIIAQVPFTASKKGTYTVSAHVAFVSEAEEVKGEVTITRRVRVADAASLASK
jgi:hypothetical protein